MEYTVRSIDLGYGNTKFTKSEDDKGGVVFDCFESIAVICDIDTTGQLYDVCHVPVNNDIYTVGHDAHLVSNVYGARPMHQDYINTPEYIALMKGALRSMDISTIDVLVLGLPVRMYRSKHHQLRDKWKGDFELGDGKKITVRNVIVTCQPIGGYLDYRNTIGLGRSDNFSGRTLVVDPGWNTLDWLVIEGMTPLVDSTSSIEMGVAGVLEKVSRRISMAACDELPFPSSPLLTEVDRWVRAGEISLEGGKFVTPIKPYIKPGRDFLEKAVTKMISSIEERHTIYEVVVVGGAANLYKPIIEKYFPRHDVIILHDSVYANVRGYQALGIQAVEKKEAAMGKETGHD